MGLGGSCCLKVKNRVMLTDGIKLKSQSVPGHSIAPDVTEVFKPLRLVARLARWTPRQFWLGDESYR